MYRRHGHVVLRRARRLLGDEHEAHDVLQDVFLALARDPEQFAQRSSMTTYLYSATTHACLNRLRNRHTQSRLLGVHASSIAPRSPSPDAEAWATARELLIGLPRDLAEVAVYYYCDEMSQQEIAQLLNCSRRHVGDLLSRAREQAKAQELSA